MQNDIPWQLLEKYFSKRANKGEKEAVVNWKDSVAENAIIFEQLKNYFGETGTLPINFKPNVKKALKKVTKNITNVQNHITWMSFSWKAASVILLILGLWWFSQQYSAKKKEPVFITINTSDSIWTFVSLPDSSHIWLNAGSSLKYPKKFGTIREVALKGEAYFEIFHDAKHSFLVNAGKTQTRVLGTKFNIRSKANENNIEVIVTQGKVSFGATGKEKVLLIPGQKGICSNLTGYTLKAENNNPNFLAWKTHELYFNEYSLDSVFKILASVYHFKYYFENNLLTKQKLSATFIKRPLDEVIQTIAITNEISIYHKNNLYIIK